MKEKLLQILDIVFGFRKFTFMLILLATAIIFRINDLINGAEFVDLLKESTLAFLAANGFEHATTAVKDYVAGKTAPAAPTAPTTNEEQGDKGVNP